MRASVAIASVALLASAIIPIFSGTAAALDFNQNRIIDDTIFDNANSMSSSQIDTFLNQFPNSCISTNSGFLSVKPIGYSPTNGFQFGGYGTAGEVISMAAQAYGLNPQVLITTLQKEQSLITGGAGCSDARRYAGALGFGCPDSGTTYSYGGLSLYQRNGIVATSVSNTCVSSPSKAGFSQQVIRAAWFFKFGEQRSEGNVNWAVTNGGWDNSDDPQSCYSGPMTQGTYQRCPSGATTFYDGYRTIDNKAVHMDTGSTAALYWYTPHFSGNQNFFNIFVSWFGSTITSGFAWTPVSQAIYTDSSRTTLQDLNNLIVGQRYYVTITLKNNGVQTWKKGLVNLGTNNPQNRPSTFYDKNWMSSSRAATIDQDNVAPGQTTSFSFWIRPSQAGYYKEYFNPVADGYAWMNDLGLYFGLNVKPRQYSWQYQGQAAYTDETKATAADQNNVSPGQRYYLTLQMKNTGNVTWLKNAVNLGTAAPYSRTSPFYDSTWLKRDRAATLDQSLVAPGQIGSFSFWVKAPYNKGGDFREYFNPVDDAYSWFPDYGVYWPFSVKQPNYSWQYQDQGIYTDDTGTTAADPNNLSPNTRYFLRLHIKNTGNVLWGKGLVNLGTSSPYNRSSNFHDGTWPSSNRAAYTSEGTVGPGQIATYGFWIKTPPNVGTYREYFDPVADGIKWLDDYGVFWSLTVK